MKSNQSASYLTIDQSSAIKGVLMLLIMLGHNHILAPIGGQLFQYLYNFHIFGFFILPFLYNRNIPWDKKKAINGFIKIWVPYIVFFIFCYLLYHVVVLKDRIDAVKMLYGLVNANERTIKDIAGFGFLWFLPAYYSMSLFMMLFVKPNKYAYIIILLVGILLNYNLSFTRNYLYTNIPFALVQGFYYFTFGFITKLLLDKIKNVQYIGSLIFIVISILYWNHKIEDIRYLFPISGFLLIYSISNPLAKIPLLVEIGKLSFPIYLIHVIVYNTFERLLPTNILFGYLDFLLTLSISMLLSYWIVKFDRIRKLVLPKNWNDYKSLFFR